MTEVKGSDSSDSNLSREVLQPTRDQLITLNKAAKTA